MHEELKQLFREGAMENLTELEEALLKLGENPEDKHEIDRVFRVMHTIKGSAGMIGLADVASFTHHLETEFDKIRSGKMRVTPVITNCALKARDQLFSMIEAHFGGEAAEDAVSQEILSQIIEANSIPPESVKPSPMKSALGLVQECTTILNLLNGRLGDLDLIDRVLQGLQEMRGLAVQEGLESISEFACEFEKLFKDAQRQTVVLSSEAIALTETACNEIRGMFEEAFSASSMEAMDPMKIMESLQRPLAIIESLKHIREKLGKTIEPGIGRHFPTANFRIRIFLTRNMLEKGYTVNYFLNKLQAFGHCSTLSLRTDEQIATDLDRMAFMSPKLYRVA
jgi:chemotaxis protein histidine kinase CheA